MTFIRCLSAVLAAIPALALNCPADEAADKANAVSVSEKHAPALVQVKAALIIQPTLVDGPDQIKDQLSSIPPQEQEMTTLAVTVHPSGIIAAPLAQLNPVALMGKEVKSETPLGPLTLSMSASFQTVNVIDSAGAEHPATVVMQDEKEGVALLKLEEREGDHPSVTLSETALKPEPFEPLVFLSRLGAKFGYEPVIRRGRYVQTLPQPTPFFDLTGMLSDLGTAVFDSKGNFAGISVISSVSVENGSPAVVILPQSRINRHVRKILASK